MKRALKRTLLTIYLAWAMLLTSIWIVSYRTLLEVAYNASPFSSGFFFMLRIHRGTLSLEWPSSGIVGLSLYSLFSITIILPVVTAVLLYVSKARKRRGFSVQLLEGGDSTARGHKGSDALKGGPRGRAGPRSQESFPNSPPTTW